MTCRSIARVAAAIFLLAFGAVSAADFQAGQEVLLSSGGTLRARPTPDGAVVLTAPPGATAKLRAHISNPAGSWWLAEVTGQTGWVEERSIASRPAPVPPAPVAATPPAPEPPPSQQPTAPVTGVPTPQAPPDARPLEREDRSAEIAEISRLVQSTVIEERIRGCERLAYSGITDAKLFDALDVWLRERYQDVAKGGERAEFDVARCMQGLASSGDMKYLETLQTWVQSPNKFMNKRARRYVADRAIALLHNSAIWNPIINDPANHVGGRSWPATRVVNMIKSGNAGLQREGLRRLVHHRKEFADLFPVVEQELLATYPQAAAGTPAEDVLAWMCKTLGQSRDPRYQATLTKISRDAKTSKLRDNAGTGLDILKSPDTPEAADRDESPD